MVDSEYKNNWKKRSSELVEKNILQKSQKEALVSMIDSPDTENFILAEELLRLKVSEVLVDGLNNGQSKAFLKIVDFFNNPKDNKGVVIKGYAGTGKTFMIKRIIEYITIAYPSTKMAITTPTNKAVSVVSKNSPFENESAVFEDYKQPTERIVFCTAHKLLGYKEKISNTGVQSFEPDSKGFNESYGFVIVDEISMLDDRLFKKLISLADKAKLIFLGGLSPK